METPEGDRALERGRWANARRKAAPRNSGRTGQIPQGFPTLQGRSRISMSVVPLLYHLGILNFQELDDELGGVDGYFTMFGMHYVGMFANPRMRVLFDTRRERNSNSNYHMCHSDSQFKLTCLW